MTEHEDQGHIGMKTSAPARLYVLMARKASVAVILRRGPREEWQMWLWDTDRDRFTPGQWFRGIIDVGSCDVSPDGRYVVMALKKNRYRQRTWEGDHHTSVSRPPYFSALAYSPSSSREWQGGYFSDKRRIVVYSRFDREGARVIDECPLQITHGVRPRDRQESMEADGWTTHYCESSSRHRFQGVRGFVPGTVVFSLFESLFKGRGEDDIQKTLRNKKVKFLGSKSRENLTLTIQIRGTGTGDKTKYQLRFEDQEFRLVDAIWAGFDNIGRCLMTSRGQVLMLSVKGGDLVKQVLADLNDYEFENIAPPGWALKWAKK